MASETTEELDDDGLVVQKYDSLVLVVLPPEDFGDQILRYARSSLYNIHVGTWSVSTVTDEMIKGRLQDEFMVDGPLAGCKMDDYSGILLAGSDGSNPLAADAAVLQLVREAHAAGKLIAGWGNALDVMVKAGVVKGAKVTGSEDLAASTKSAGGKFTGRQIQVSGHIITAADESAGMRFGQALAEEVRI
jgi:protease I